MNIKEDEIKIDTYLQNEVGVFMLDGDKYRWMSINDSENDDRIMELNEEVVAFVKSKCN